MNEFVEECRSEWKRLGVPDPVAGEMAADLAADLEEAEAEGASAEDVLGTGAFDARSFAAAWAAERGVVRRPRSGLPRRSRVPAAIATFALIIAIVGAVLVIAASPAAPRVSAFPAAPPNVALTRVAPTPAPTDGAIAVWVVAPEDLLGDTLPTNDSGVDTRTVGSVLLIVGLAGFVPLTLFWLWVGSGSRPRRRPAY
ncbi:MAG TPA: hypothetical protein VGJ77_10180 [Gaiellaceae bacterium]